MIASRIFERNRLLDSKFNSILDQQPDLFTPKTIVYEKVYFVPNDPKQYVKIQEQKLSVYLSGTLESKEWLVNNEPCQIDPETNFYFARVRRNLNQKILFKFKIGDDDKSSFYELSKLYDKDGSDYVNNQLYTSHSSISEANYHLHRILCS